MSGRYGKHLLGDVDLLNES